MKRVRSSMPFVARMPKIGRLQKKAVDTVLRAFVGTLVEELRAGRRVVIPGLGVFRPKARSSHRMRLPQGDVLVPARTLLTFRAAKEVRILEETK